MKIGIIGAEKQEVELLYRELEASGQPVDVRRRANLEFHQGFIDGKPVVVVCCGVGKVNAALCAQVLICDFGVDAIVNTGSAGGLAEGLNVLDMVVCTDAVQHDFDTTPFGYAAGQIPGTESPFFKADQAMRDKALAAFSRVSPRFETPSRMIPGRIATGDAFISNPAARDRIVSLFSPACVEMEGGAVAQACVANGTPFVIIRSISDLAGHEADMSYADFSRQASHRSAAVVIDFVKHQ